MNFSVIRAADTQLGMAFAAELAAQRRHLLLIGHQKEALAQLGYRLADQFEIKVHYFVNDDSDTAAVIAICNHINDHYDVDCLINLSSAYDAQGFADANITTINKKLTTSVVSGPVFVHQLLPNLLRHQDSCIFILSHGGPDALDLAIQGFNGDFSVSFNREMHLSEKGLRVHDIRLPDIGSASGNMCFSDEAVGEIVAQMSCHLFYGDPANLVV
jgi:hypothetical protein